MSRKNAIVAIALLPAAVGLVLLLLVSRATLESWVLERSANEHQGLASSLAAGLTAQLDYQRQQLQLLTKGSDFADLPLQSQVDRSINGLPEALEPRKRALMEALRQQAGFSVVFVLSPNGDHYMSQPFAVQKSLRQFNLSGRPYFQQSQRTRTTVVSEMFLGADGIPAIAMNVPVMDSAGNIVLYVGGVVHLTQLQSLIAPQHIAPFDLAVLRDGQGQVLARSDAIQSYPDSTALLALLDQSASVASATLLRLDNGRWMDFSAPVGAQWTLHALRDENRLLAEITPAMARLTGAALLALLVPTLLGLWMALRYSRRAHQADRALQDANAQLEARVLARTQELSRSELRLRTLFESAADAVLIIEDRRIIECNPAAVALFGVGSSSDLVGHDPSVFSPAQQPGNVASAELARQYFDALLGQPDLPLSFEWTHLRVSTGQTFVAMVRLSLMHIEGRVLMQANVRDISERLQAQEDLRIASKVFESWEGMTVTDAQNRILRVNSAFTRITGYAASEVIGQTPKLLQSGRHGPEFYRTMRHALATEGFWQGEVWNRRKSGEIYPQLLTISTVKNAAGDTTHYVGIFLDQSSQKAAEQQIEHLAFYDPLTGLANRRLLLDRMAQAQAASLRHARHNALLLVDLDEFKLLNDSLGHEAGDAILQQLAQRVRHCQRDGDTAARCGGDEFALMLEDLSEDPLEAAAQAEEVAEKMRTELALPCILPDREHRTTCSFGVALFGGAGASQADSPLKQAEVAMFQAKQAGRNSIRFFEPRMQEAVSNRAALEVELRQAIDTGQLLLYYQPQVSGDGRTCGVEALVRWQHPKRGMVSPADFIPLAEETGLILPLGQWVLEQACRQLAAWQGQPATAALSVAVNVSARQFHHPQFVDVVRAALRSSGANARLLKLELTESMLVQDVDTLVAKMNALRALGVCFALDDFGTGYSSLAYLKRLPLNQLKIDQGFVHNLLTDANDVAIAKMVVALAQSLNLSVIAEGVEHPAQRDCLAHLGCYQYQGYLFGRPMSVQSLEAMLEPPQ